MEKRTLFSRAKYRWNAFMNRDPTVDYSAVNVTYHYRPDRVRLSRTNERSIVNPILNKIATDAAIVDILHVNLDENDRYISTRNSSFNDIFSLEANIDQTALAFKHDMYLSMLDEGCIAVVPVDTDTDPEASESFKILSARTGQILAWSPDKVQVRVYNEKTGKRQDIWVPKRSVAILENPFYSVMNDKNSTLQRLIRKLNLLDAVDEQSSSGKLDMIIQLPYTIKSQARKDQAEERRKSIEDQLKNSKYGIAYADATERITQLNRPIENNLMKQIEYLTSMLYSQLGINQSVMDGSADEKTMLNYNSRIIEVLVSTAVTEFKRKFLTKTARSQRQSIIYVKNPFGLVPVEKLAEIADKFTRNEILTSNEFRQIIGFKPSDDPKADQLRNSNINQSAADEQRIYDDSKPMGENNKEGENQNGKV